MDTYRIINRELSINNQELRNVINKLKCEVTNLNRQLLEQREEFNRLKVAIATKIEQKHIETMALIYPEKNPEKFQQSKIDIASHRRSCSNATAADPIKNKSHSPPAGSSSSSCTSDVMDESSFKPHIPKIVIEGIARLSKSPGKCSQSFSNRSQSRTSENLQIASNCSEDINNTENSDLEQTLITSNASLVTINEEKSYGPEAPNETLSDATINCLLDAPCSTPYNQHKLSNETTFPQKELRVLVKKISEEKIAQLIAQSSHRSRLSAYRKQNNTSFKLKSAQIEACHLERKSLTLNNSHCTTMNNSLFRYNINASSDRESFTEQKSMPNKIQIKEKVISVKDKSIKMPLKRAKPKGKQNKENVDTDSDLTCSEDECTVGRRRLRHKQLSLKEPSLRGKLRNTTNIKL